MIHAFPYSKRDGTPAAVMDGQVPEGIRHQRVRILAERQKHITAALLTNELNSRPTVAVLFEDYKSGYAIGHTDNFVEVRVASPRPLHSIMAQVQVLRTDGSCLFGALV